MPILVAQVYRREPRAGAERSGPIRNVRPFLGINAGTLPDPIRESDFWQQGKPVSNAAARMPMWYGFNIAGIETQQQDDFAVPKMIFTNQSSRLGGTAAGLQAPLIERANIFRPEARAYGSQYTLSPQESPSYFPNYGPYSSVLGSRY